MLNLEKMSFHDVYILGININTKKDHFDQITLFLESSEFVSDFATDKVILKFRECYKANLQLQMWIEGKDSIRSFEVLEQSNLLLEAGKILKASGSQLVTKLKHFQLNLNTSNSTIDILAEDVIVEPVSAS